MVEAKFKPGDHIVPDQYRKGLEKAEVIKVEDGKYYLKIVRGIAILPIGAQVNYKLQDIDNDAEWLYRESQYAVGRQMHFQPQDRKGRVWQLY